MNIRQMRSSTYALEMTKHSFWNMNEVLYFVIRLIQLFTVYVIGVGFHSYSKCVNKDFISMHFEAV